MNNETTNNHNAFDIAKDKKQEKQHVHTIKPRQKMEGEGLDAILWIGYRLADLANAAPGNGQRRGLGFATEAVVFTLDDDEYELSTPWTNFKSR